jgi:hypothetical protein
VPSSFVGGSSGLVVVAVCPQGLSEKFTFPVRLHVSPVGAPHEHELHECGSTVRIAWPM